MDTCIIDLNIRNAKVEAERDPNQFTDTSTWHKALKVPATALAVYQWRQDKVTKAILDSVERWNQLNFSSDSFVHSIIIPKQVFKTFSDMVGYAAKLKAYSLLVYM